MTHNEMLQRMELSCLAEFQRGWSVERTSFTEMCSIQIIEQLPPEIKINITKGRLIINENGITHFDKLTASKNFMSWTEIIATGIKSISDGEYGEIRREHLLIGLRNGVLIEAELRWTSDKYSGYEGHLIELYKKKHNKNSR